MALDQRSCMSVEYLLNDSDSFVLVSSPSSTRTWLSYRRSVLNTVTLFSETARTSWLTCPRKLAQDEC